MDSRAEPPLGLRLLLTMVVGLAAYLLVASILLAAFGGGETLESVLYAGAFVAVLPVALAGGARLAGGLDRAGTLEPVTLALAGTLVVLLVAARGVYAVTGGATIGTPGFVAALVGWVAVSALAVRRAGDGPSRAALRVWLAALCVALALGFPPARLLHPGELVATLALAAVLALAYVLLSRRAPGRRWGVALDIAAVLALVLLANDVQLYADPEHFYAIDGHLHENFYLGPANDVLHGRPMLVDTFSQYGVGLIYGLAAWSKVASIGYGAMTLLSALLAAMEIAAVYVILRLARVSRPLAFAAGAVAGIALFFAGALPAPTSHPSLGGLRYLPPYLVVAAAVAGARSARFAPWWWAAAALVGLSSVWSVEAFGYSAAAFGGMAALRAALTAPVREGALRVLVALLVPGVIAVVAAQLVFALLTLVLTGSLPDWGGYVAFLGSYSVDGISSLPIEPWSPALVTIAVYVGSLAALALMVASGRTVVAEDRPALIALAGIVPFGAVSFTYFIGNSFPDAALLVGIPAYVAIALWLSLAERRRDLLPRAARASAVALTALLVASIVVFAWPTIRDRAGDTPLAMALPDGGGQGSLRNELARMWRSDPLDARYEPAKALARRYFPGDGPIPTVATTESTVTVLMESGRVNALPVSHFLQEGLVLDRSWPRVRRAIDRLEPGSLILVERQALEPVYPAPLLERTTAELERRFRLRYVAGDPNGFFVARLSPVRGAGG